MITHKVCKSCGKNLEVSNFTKSKNVKDGYENKCKICRANARKKYINICEVCGEKFKTAKKGVRFCSVDCQGIAKRDRVNIKCDYCDKDIEVVKSKLGKQAHFYCNQNCRTEHLKILMQGENNHNYNQIDYKCDGCGKDIKTYKYKIENQKYIFCSNECYKQNIGKFFEGKNNPNYIEEENRACMQCGTNIKRKPGQFNNKWFCSKTCSSKYNAKFKENKKVVSCDYCGKEVKRAKSQFNGKHSVYCSRECQHKGWSILYSGENSPIYNHDKPLEERLIERKYVDYYEWRRQVYEKDNYTCQCCDDNRGGNLVAHHILNYSEHDELRTDVNNGITLCKTCHKLFHDTYGYRNNNEEQLKEFLNKHKNQAS